jgi:hypothetical protein
LNEGGSPAEEFFDFGSLSGDVSSFDASMVKQTLRRACAAQGLTVP